MLQVCLMSNKAGASRFTSGFDEHIHHPCLEHPTEPFIRVLHPSMPLTDRLVQRPDSVVGSALGPDYRLHSTGDIAQLGSPQHSLKTSCNEPFSRHSSAEIQNDQRLLHDLIRKPLIRQSSVPPGGELCSRACTHTERDALALADSSHGTQVRTRIRSGSQGKARSLQPPDFGCDRSQQYYLRDSSDCASQAGSARTQPALLPTKRLELNSKNLQTLDKLSELKNLTRYEEFCSSSKIKGEDQARICSTSEGAASPNNFSLIPSPGTSPRSYPSSCGGRSKSASGSCPTASFAEESLKNSCLSFFYPGTVLPGPPAYSVEGTTASTVDTGNSGSNPASVIMQKASSRLQTMISKQRRVDFDHDDIEPDFKNSNINDNQAKQQETCAVDETNKQASVEAHLTMGKVRCALTKSERILGIKWIHNVDTSSTTNPHVTPEVRYHASILFSLYWGSRATKVTRLDNIIPSQQKMARDLQGEREAKKKMKLIAATAMACLTLAIKWHFDFCKPLFTVQLMSFCKTTDFRTFKLTPEDLIIAERAVLFSYPVAGGLWLDCPHAFLEELIHIIIPLKRLSSTPHNILETKARKFDEMAEAMSGPSQPRDPRKDRSWDWPVVMREFDRALAKATTIQEFLAFDPTVFCVVALYIALDAVEPGYYEKTHERRIKKHLTELRAHEEAERANVDPALIYREDNPGEIQNQPSNTVPNTGADGQFEELWVWRWVDVNDTMDQVCQATKVSGLDVEDCLNWFCELECI